MAAERTAMPLFHFHLVGEVMAGASQAGTRVVDPALDDGLSISNSVAVRALDERIGQQAEELSPSVSQMNGSLP
jgi:hypothetical protein